MFNNVSLEIRAFYEVMRCNIVESDWIPKATNTRSEYVIRIAVPRR
jgi:hypothetical protein